MERRKDEGGKIRGGEKRLLLTLEGKDQQEK